MTNNPIETADPLAQQLRAMTHDSPGLSDIAQLYDTILPILRDADLRVTPVSLNPEQAREKMAKGVPLLYDINLEFDEGAVRELMILLADAAERSGQKNQAAARRLRQAIEEQTLEVNRLLPHVTANEKDAVRSVARRLDLDADLVWTVSQNALKPALRAWCRQLAPVVGEISWHKGSCFVCGAAATVAELQGNNLAKHLRCGQCGADWQFPRLQCMYCGNEDHHSLKHLYTEDHRDTLRVEVCDKCHGYLKVITVFAPSSPEMLTVQDLATLHLDYIAEARGYARGSLCD